MRAKAVDTAAKLREEATARAAAAALAKSSFASFVYVMEDLRNGLFKIGRSRTPERREKTLQSEQPSLKLRVSVPAAEEDERLLHQRFSAKRRRGEWFALSRDDLFFIVQHLKMCGDAERAVIDFAWFGEIAFIAASGDTK